MPRLRNRSNGVVVDVSDDTAERLGSEWEPADKPDPAPVKKATARKPQARSK